MGDILGAIASGGSNDGFSQISQALDYRQARLDADEAKRKQLETDQIMGKALSSGLQEGTVMHDLALKNPTAYLGITKVMGLDPTDGAGMHQLTQDVANIHALGLTGNPQAVSDYMTHVKEQRDKLGFNTTAITQGIQAFQQDPDKFLRANSVMNQALNPVKGEVMSAKDAEDAKLKREEFEWKKTHEKDMTPFEKAQVKHWEGSSSGSAEGGLSEDSVDQMAQRLLNGDKKSDVIGNFGRGAQGAVDLRRIQNRMAALAKEQNIDPAKMQNIQMDAAAEGKAIKDFTTGKQGNNVRSFNTALEHLDTLHEASQALNNGDIQLFNKVGNAWNSATGKAAPTNFDATKKIVADEIVKAIVGTGGGVADREEAAKTIQAANSPAQLNGVIEQYKDLMAGQLKGLNQQYKASTSRDDFSDRFLTEKSKKYVLPETKKDSDIGAKASNSNTLSVGKYQVKVH